MASKEYQMLFQLTAQMGKEFGSTFSAAQQKMQQIQQEVNRLNQAQGDITAYQKQQAAVENTKRKLEDLQKQYDNIQKEYQETGESSSALANKMIDKQRAIDQTSQKLEQQTQKLDAMETELKEAGVDTDNFGDEQQRLAQEMEKAADEMEEAAKEADEFGGKGAAGFEAVGAALVAAGIAEGLKEITEAYKECVELSMGFQSAMSNVEALSGATEEEMAALTAQAKELGATTKFTATEAGEAMGYMGMAGWSAEQMLAGMPGVLSLAAASGEDLSLVSDIVTDSMTAFGLTAADTSRYADILAATATNANTNVSLMGETFKVVAPLAGVLGYDVEDMAIATGILANSGVKASEAGTSLRGILTRLAKPTKESADAMEALGISLDDGHGHMYSFMELMEQMRDSFAGLTEDQQAFYAAELAGQRGMTGLLTIVNASEADFAGLSDKISNCAGAAEKMAQVKLDNLQGQMTLLESATDALKTTIGEAYQEEFQGLAKVATEIMTGVNDLLGKHPVLLKSLIAITAEAGVFLAVYKSYQAWKKISIALEPVLIALKKKEKEVTEEANAQLLLNPYVAVAASVAALTVGLIALVEAQDKEAREIRELSESSREDYIALQEKNAEYERAAELYGENSEEAQYLKWQVEELTDAYEANKQTFEEYMAAHDEVLSNIDGHINAYREEVTQLEGNASQTQALTHRLEELSSQTQKTAGDEEEMKAIIAELNELFPNLGLSIDEVTNGFADFADMEKMAQRQAEAEKKAEQYKALVQAIKDTDNAQEQLNKDIAAQEGAETHLKSLRSAFEATYGKNNLAAMLFTEEGKALMEAEKQYSGYVSAVTESEAELERVQGLHRELTEELGNAVTQNGTLTEAQVALNAEMESAQEQLAALTASYTAAYDAALESVSGQYSLWDEAGEVETVSIDKINSALESQAQHWADYQANLDALNAKAADVEGLSEVIATFADGSDESVAAIAGMASASEEDLREMVTNYQNVQNAQKDVSDSLADLTTEFTTKMDQLQKDLEEDVAAMNLSKEAAAAGKQTIDAFANEAENSYQRIYDAYAAVRQAAVNALNGGGVTVSAPKGGSAYAEGTDSATPGIHLVGEEGPELVLFQGGERVIPADETAGLMRSARTLDEAPAGAAGDGGFNVALTINVSGGDAEEGVRAAGETLRSQLEAMLEDYLAERERRAYR